MVRCSRPGRSTSSPTSSDPPERPRPGRRCERRRPVGLRDDPRGRGHRRAHDPALLRARLRVRPTVSLGSETMLAVFGIESDGLYLAVNLLILFLVVLWA